MNTDFPRILSLLRKERGLSQKQVASDLNISQALLSHYEKGIRECGLDFLVNAANYYHVSCDYMLGRSPDRTGSQLTVEDIPEPDVVGKENKFSGSVLPVLNKKLIANSLNILFDLLQKSQNNALTGEMSSFLMIAVYRMFRLIYSANPKNQEALFTLPPTLSKAYAQAAMEVCEANCASILAGEDNLVLGKPAPVKQLEISTGTLAQQYPLFTSSLLNLIQNAEQKALHKK